MRNHIHIIRALCSLVYVSASSVFPAAIPDSSLAAYLEITKADSGLAVFLDGQEIGATPLTGFAILPGEHHLLVRSPLWPSLDRTDYTEKFTADTGQTYQFTPSFPVSIWIHSIPHAAHLIIDGEKIGVTPLLLRQTTNHDPILRLEKPGYESWQSRFSSWADSLHTIILKPEAVWQQQQQVMQRRATIKTKWYRRGLYSSLLLGITSGIATIHFRSKGNDAYSAYLETAYPRQMDHYFNRAQHYDRLAGASYTVFELCFIFSGYFFLKSRK